MGLDFLKESTVKGPWSTLNPSLHPTNMKACTPGHHTSGNDKKQSHGDASKVEESGYHFNDSLVKAVIVMLQAKYMQLLKSWNRLLFPSLLPPHCTPVGPLLSEHTEIRKIESKLEELSYVFYQLLHCGDGNLMKAETCVVLTKSV